MTAHDKLESQLRASVAQLAGRTPRRRRGLWPSSLRLSVVIVMASTTVALAIALLAVLALHHRGRAIPPAATHRTHHRAGIGPRPKDPGPIPSNVDDAVVAAGWNTAFAKEQTCAPGSRPPTRTATTEASPSAAMLSTIPVLRRPGTPADRLPRSFRPDGPLELGFASGKVYIRYFRRARIADGITFYLVPATKRGRPPMTPAAANYCYQLEVAALRASLPTVPRSKRAATLRYGQAEYALGRYNLETSTVNEGEGIYLITQRTNGSGGADGGQSPATIRQTGMLGGGGGGTPPSPIVMDGIVPPGVATVTLTFPTGNLPALSVTGDVVNNVFVIPIPTLFQRGGWPATAIWRSASGKVIRTVNERPFHP
jgi:hypothetical protein